MALECFLKVSNFQYLKVGHFQCFNKVEAESNSQNILQNPSPPKNKNTFLYIVQTTAGI